MTANPYSAFGPKPELGWLQVADLHVDRSYQRSLETRRSQRLIDSIAADFNWFLFGTVLTVRGLVGHLIIDGQHRVEGAKRRRIAEVPAAQFPTLTLAQQAKAFVDANRLRVTVSTYAVFHAQVAAGDPAAVTIAELCAEAGCSIPRAPGPATGLKPGETLAIGAIKTLIAGHGGAVALQTLTTLREALPEPGALRAHYITALGNLVRRRRDLSLPKLKAALLAKPFEAIETAVAMHVIQHGGTRIEAAEALFIALLQLGAEQAPGSPAIMPRCTQASLNTRVTPGAKGPVAAAVAAKAIAKAANAVRRVPPPHASPRK